MISVSVANDFAAWRILARELVLSGTAPGKIAWTSGEQNALFNGPQDRERKLRDLNVPKAFLDLGEAVACFDDAERWPLLYRIVFRLAYENKNLLKIESDPDVRAARLMEKAVKRDVHKFHAFVRFRTVDCEGEEVYVAWHEPRHFTVERAAPFFQRRFGSMKFVILTPKGCVDWDLKQLTFGPAADRSLAPTADATEDFWLTYYRSIFNPFRLKVSAMKKELPVRHWPTLPESVLIPELIREAQKG
jgi:uracil-DNA glycosylase